MKKIRRLSLVLLTLLVALILVPVAYAHPLGNFTINHYAGIRVSPQEIEVDYVMDMAEIPAFQELASIDMNHNNKTDANEALEYRSTQCEAIRKGLSLQIGSQEARLELLDSTLVFPAGQGGLLTLRLNCIYTVYTGQMRDTAGDFRVDFSNQNYPDRLGWREIVVTGQSVSLEGDFMSKSISNRLVSYPNDLLANPPDQRQVSFEARPGESKIRLVPASERMPGGVTTVDRNDGFTRLILQNETTIPALLLALGIAFAWGAMHAMTPGHGKTIVGAYLVGSRGTALHALYLGLTTTITHTAGVFVLGAVTMFASRVLFPERLFPWLSLVSGLLVVGIGVSLFWNRQKAARKRVGQPVIQEPGFSSNGAHDHSPSQRHPNERDHDHDHNHDHNHDHDHDHDHTHSHTHDSNSYHHHDHTHEEYPRHHDLELHGHQHGPGGHTHLPPGSDGSPVTWRSLLMLGISGGLLPCPSALVVMLSAIALGRIGFGLLLVVAFSLGLATVLAGIGLVFVYAGKIFERFPVQARLLRWFPAVSAIFIALVGAGIAARALVEIGVL